MQRPAVAKRGSLAAPRHAAASASAAPAASAGGEPRTPGQAAAARKRDSTLNEIRRMEKAREERRRNIEQARANRAVEEARNIANGNPGDVDFQRMIADFRAERAGRAQAPVPPGDLKICIAVRKRPVNAKEIRRKDHDSVSCFNPEVTVHDCKLRVDGITKYLDSSDFRFDYAFGDDSENDDVYFYTAKPLVPFVVARGRATVFAYGQTGSGKTFTMQGIQQHVVEDLFTLLDEGKGPVGPGGEPPGVFVSYFEIYGGRCQDLLNNRHRLAVREDGKGDVHIAGLEEAPAGDASALAELIGRGNANRTTHATESNDESSRSHAICQISLRDGAGRLQGKLSLIDLAGSERGADTNSHNRQRRMEGAEINKSLLALKECIRALDSDSTHIPYRASKLTLVLKDSFTRKTARTVMIATVSPAGSSADHTLNTLRYADRVKEQRVAGAGGEAAAAAADGAPDPAGAGAGALPPPPPPEGPNGAAEPAGNGLRAPAAPFAAGKEARRAREGWNDNKAWEQQQPGDDMSVNDVREREERRAFKRPAAAAGSHRPPPRARSSRGDAALAAAAAADGPPEERYAPAKAAPSRRAAGSSAAAGAGSGSNGGRAVEAKARPRPQQRRLVEEEAQYNDEDDESGGSGRSGGERFGGGGGALQRSQASDDIDYLHETLRKYNTAENDTEEVVELHRTVQGLFEEEEELLNLHMTVIQENAELLTEEGRLLQQIQGDDVVDYDIDAYAARLAAILDKKAELTGRLQRRLRAFRRHLEAEESVSRRVRSIPQY